jgi:hypothetical protein
MRGGIPALLTAAFLLASSSSGGPALAAATPAATVASEATATPGDAKISLDDYLAGVSKPGMTDAKKKEFAHKYEGQKVTWTGYVRAVTRNKSRGGDTFLLILKAKPVSDPPPGAFVASFDVSQEKAVTALQENQEVTVSGVLSVGNPIAPVLEGATLDK